MIETLSIEVISQKKKRFIILDIYRSPDSDGK